MNLLAFVWGFAEATLFFIVPDVALSVIGLGGVRRGAVAVGYAVAGAVLGGGLMYLLGSWDLEQMMTIVGGLPGIRPNNATSVRTTLAQNGGLAIFQGVVLAIPYKVYALHAHLSLLLPTFLLISVPARAIRFLLLGVAMPWLLNFQLPGLEQNYKTAFLLAMWLVFYLFLLVK